MVDIVIVIVIVIGAALLALRLVRNQQAAARSLRLAARQAEVDAMVASAARTQKAAINAAFNKKLGPNGAAVGFLVLQLLKNKGK